MEPYTAISALLVKFGINAFTSYKEGEIKKEQIRARLNILNKQIKQNKWNVERETTRLDLAHQEDFLTRMKALNNVRAKQQTIIGYNNVSSASLANIEAADQEDFNYDSKIAELNTELNKDSVLLQGINNQEMLEAQKEAAKAGIETATTQQALSIGGDAVDGVVDYLKLQ